MNFPIATPIILLTIAILVGYAIGHRLYCQAFRDRAFEEVDLLFKNAWDGSRYDEILAWYRVRNKVISMKHEPKIHRQALLDALEIRISQCRERNKTFRTVHFSGGKPTVINTQN